ncbi:competence protein ComK [Radiobacillus sp. PE A8.2]|uniref:competence protein ComK n=1 Tax=Radiobacillus sp. PE A8.2 TaxID=3380349 RepID=UPI00388EDEC2
MKKDYEINLETMAVLAKEVDGSYVAQILEDDESYYVHHVTRKVIDSACRFFGSSLKGRQDGTKTVCGISHKAPISIAPSGGMYFFPTTSPQNPKCSWIAHSHVESIIKSSNEKTQVTFVNGVSILLDVSFGSLSNQLRRTAQYRYILENRLNDL